MQQIRQKPEPAEASANASAQLAIPIWKCLPKTPGSPRKRKENADLPSDASTRQPVALLDYMRPQLEFHYFFLIVDPQHVEVVFAAAIKVDGMLFFGQGRSKKLARKAAAVAACKALFGVTFDSSVV